MGNLDSQKTYSKMFEGLQDCERYFHQKLWKQLNEQTFNVFSVIGKNDKDRQKFSMILKRMTKKPEDFNLKQFQFNQRTNRSVACFLGLAICDAFGASTQFIPFVKDRRDLIDYDFKDIQKQINCGLLQPRFGKIGVWTDDCSMALCIADSLLIHKFKFVPKHTRYLFHMWLYHGLNNGGREQSIGLGGNIKISMDQFCKYREDFTEEKDKFNNGNGSLMRLAPIPICFSGQQQFQQGLKLAALQSKTTHNGDQAAQCSKLMTLIIIRLINRKEQKNWKQVITLACEEFLKNKTIQTVACLAKSIQESEQLYEHQKQTYKQKFAKFNKSPVDRNWNWKDPNFTYSPTRFKQQPGYIGSYCMDALAMALHTVWHTSTFKEVALMNANMGGDCDTVGAIAGQIAGAIYGIDPFMLHLYSQMDDCKKERYEVFLKAFKLATHSQL